MCRPYASRLVGTGYGGSILPLCGVMLLFAACSSSPTKDETMSAPAPAARTPVSTTAVSPTTSAKSAVAPAETTKAKSKKADAKQAAVQPEVEPAGPPPPPPVPPQATQQFEKALTLLGAGDFAPAAKEFQALSNAYPDYSGPLTNLGIVYLKTGKLAEAEKTLKAATQRGEPSSVTFNQLGIVYRKLGRFKDADEAYSQAIRIDPNYALAHLNLGVLCDMYLQQPQRALAEFERYIQLVPNPDARVATWVKELQGRVGGGKPAAQSPPPAAEPAANAVANKDTAGA